MTHAATAVPRYQVRNGEFVKWGYVDLDDEFVKAQALCAVAGACGFMAPQPKRFDRNQGSITYDFLPDLAPIRSAYLQYMSAPSEAPAALALIASAGRALAMIHRRLQLPKTTDWRPSAEFERAFQRVSGSGCEQWMAQAPWAVAHCDYGFSNVQTSAASDIVVIDPSANGYVTFSAALRAPIHIDLANFVACIEGLVPPAKYPRMKWRRLPRVREAFIAAYEGESGLRLERRLIAQIAYATAYCYFRREYGDSLKAKLALGLLFNRFKRNNVDAIL